MIRPRSAVVFESGEPAPFSFLFVCPYRFPREKLGQRLYVISVMDWTAVAKAFFGFTASV
jgi:hypothetical protein